jgi:hypothetical protein
MNAEGACDVTSRGDDATLPRSANRYGESSKRRVIKNLDGSEKSVNIDVQYWRLH